TGAAVVTGPSSATLHGTVNSDATVSTWFQYSTDRAFSPTLARTVGSGFNNPTGVAVDAAGDLFVADPSSGAITEVLPDGTDRAIGSGFKSPQGVAVDALGDVFVADTGNNAVKEILPDGTVRTLASGFIDTRGVAVDAAGHVFVADSGNGTVKEV